MKKLSLALLLAGGCMEPPQGARMEQAVAGLADLHAWDPEMQGRGQYAYDAVTGWGPDILPVLTAHLTDATPTALHDSTFDITATVSDVCFLLLVQMTGVRWEEFYDDGVFLSSQLPNPVFCVRWANAAARHRVQARFRQILAERSGKKK